MTVTLELRPEPEDVETEQQRRRDNLSLLQGKYAHLPGGSEEFAAQKAKEKAREERHWQSPAATD